MLIRGPLYVGHGKVSCLALMAVSMLLDLESKVNKVCFSKIFCFEKGRSSSKTELFETYVKQQQQQQQ